MCYVSNGARAECVPASLGGGTAGSCSLPTADITGYMVVPTCCSPSPPPPSPPPCECPAGTCDNIPASSCCSNPAYVCSGSVTYSTTTSPATTCPIVCFPFAPVIPSPFPSPPPPSPSPPPPSPSPPPPSPPPPSPPPCECPGGFCDGCCSNPLYVCAGGSTSLGPSGTGASYASCPIICFPFAPVIPSPHPSPPPPLTCEAVPAQCMACTEYQACYDALFGGTAANLLPNSCQTAAGGGTARPECMPTSVVGGTGPDCAYYAAILSSCGVTTTTSCTACSDPHLSLPHGGRADFKGEHNSWYNMLSARNVSFNVLFQHDDFKNPYKLVHGSAMKSAAWVIRSNLTGSLVTIEYNATSSGVTRALAHVSGFEGGQYITHGGKPFVFENVKVEMKEKRLSGASANTKGKAWHGTALIVTAGNWQINVWNKPYPNAAANPGKSLLNVNIDPLHDADADPVAPHGLIGQAWDGDGEPMDGLLDDYSTKEVTTQAMGEGAIEGKAVDYKLRHKFATHFKYSRFDALTAKHRDVSKLEKA